VAAAPAAVAANRRRDSMIPSVLAASLAACRFSVYAMPVPKP
jgi:hypothetical protein